MRTVPFLNEKGEVVGSAVVSEDGTTAKITTSEPSMIVKLSDPQISLGYQVRTSEPKSGRYAVVDTDNHDGDYPNEKFVGPSLPTEALASTVAACFNEEVNDASPRFYKVVELPYELQPGFEP